MRLLIATLALALMVSGAWAQSGSQIGGSQIGQNLTKAEQDAEKNKPKAKVDDKAYNAALRIIPNKQYDPWHGVR